MVLSSTGPSWALDARPRREHPSETAHLLENFAFRRCSHDSQIDSRSCCSSGDAVSSRGRLRRRGDSLGIGFLEYVKESGDPHVPDSRHLIGGTIEMVELSAALAHAVVSLGDEGSGIVIVDPFVG